jgi:hypothetical protein
MDDIFDKINQQLSGFKYVLAKPRQIGKSNFTYKFVMDHWVDILEKQKAEEKRKLREKKIKRILNEQ